MRAVLCAFLSLLFVVTAVSARIGGGDITYEVKHIGNVIFHHDTHVETMGFNCTECHPFIFETKEKHKKFQMSHRRQAVSCGVCHDGKGAFDLKTNCYVCHIKGVK